MQAESVLDYDVFSLAREQRLYLLARITAGKRPTDAQRRPLNLSVVLDRSGSMAGDKLENVRRATAFLVQRLGADDRFSLVTYNEAVTVDVPPGPVQHKDRITQAIKALRANGTTNLSGGWLQGCTLVAEQLVTGQVNRVLLLTDGLANEGITDTVRLAAIARQKRAEGVTTTTIGVGLGFNEDLLTQLANEGGGAFYFIDNPDRAPLIFSEELQDLLNVIGQNLTVTLTLTGEVEHVTQLNAYPADEDVGHVTYRLGDLYADETKMLLLELHVPRLASLGEAVIGHLRFEYDELGEDSVTHRELTLPVTVNAAPADDADQAAREEEVMRSVLLLGAARAREEAIRRADAGDFADASQVLSQAADAIEQAGLADEDLNKEHNMLREEAIDMELGPQRYDSYSRKTSSAKSHYARARQSRQQLDETVALHGRLKSSRRALERGGPAPTRLSWRGESLPLADRDRVTIGRSDKNDVVIKQEEVSAQHCQIVRDGDDLYLEDLGSTNGTFANGGRVGERFRLSVGDIITVGNWLFILRGD
ncbi:MAG: VWA domain-containing protein [Anaerolineae bacterium]|nr:VWA domain-containing protein [Anaerolineae bacterium]